MKNSILLKYDRGSLLLEEKLETCKPLLEFFKFDTRIQGYRASARSYRQIILKCHELQLSLIDQAKQLI